MEYKTRGEVMGKFYRKLVIHVIDEAGESVYHNVYNFYPTMSEELLEQKRNTTYQNFLKSKEVAVSYYDNAEKEVAEKALLEKIVLEKEITK